MARLVLNASLCRGWGLFALLLSIAGLFAFNSAVLAQEPKADAPAGRQTESDSVADAEVNDAESEESAAEEAGHEDAAHAQDVTDLSHANASEQLEAANEVRFDHVVGTIAIFLVLFAILAKLAWKPITQALDSRDERIRSMIEEAERNNEAAAARLREYEARLLAAAEESRAIVAQAQKDAERAGERIKAEAEAAAERERARAVSDIQAAKNSALDEVAQKSVDLAVSLAGRIIQKQLNPSDHAKLINEALEQFPSRN